MNIKEIILVDHNGIHTVFTEWEGEVQFTDHSLLQSFFAKGKPCAPRIKDPLYSLSVNITTPNVVFRSPNPEPPKRPMRYSHIPLSNSSWCNAPGQIQRRAVEHYAIDVPYCLHRELEDALLTYMEDQHPGKDFIDLPYEADLLRDMMALKVGKVIYDMSYEFVVSTPYFGNPIGGFIMVYKPLLRRMPEKD